MTYTDIKLGGVGVTQIALADGTVLWKKTADEQTGLTLTNTSGYGNYTVKVTGSTDYTIDVTTDSVCSLSISVDDGEATEIATDTTTTITVPSTATTMTITRSGKGVINVAKADGILIVSGDGNTTVTVNVSDLDDGSSISAYSLL